MTISVKMLPHVDWMQASEGGVNTVVRKWFKYLPNHGIKLVAPDAQSYDVIAVHAGATKHVGDGSPVVSHLHGVYFGDERPLERYEHAANGRISYVMQRSKRVTVPSEWVAETIRRETRINPDIIPHALDHEEWAYDGEHEGYVFAYAKNRISDVCDPRMALRMANHIPEQKFMVTLGMEKFMSPNIKATGLLPYKDMIQAVQRAAVYVSPIKETWGLGAAEALAAGVPVLTVDAGNVPSFVTHGYNGYCYEPGELEDMIEGIHWCLEHRDILSKNAVQSVKHLTWEEPMEKLADVYRRAAAQEEPTVGVVIPVYNKPPEMVLRAVESALNQTHPPEKVVVVDDHSDYYVQEKLENLLDDTSKIEFVRHEQNRGVAHARNTGVSILDTKYVCCLDSDDAIEPGFLESCIVPMERDRSIGVSYTKLKWIKPDGSTGVSKWPDEWDYDKFLKKQNQVPTCCVYRKLMWERLGGYRQRYAPTGAGAEDAEFFLRAGAYGFAGKLATDAPLFLYSWQSGHTSSKDYQEPDWLAWHPDWVSGRNHPLVSHATPKNNIAHQALQYDKPDVSVVIPVGPNHVHHLYDVLDSLEAQTYPLWEAIVVLDVADRTDEIDDLNRIAKAYPYVKWGVMHGDEPYGAGAARNVGADKARAPMLLFVDADDYLHPDFIRKSMRAWVQTKRAVYTDYAGKAIIHDESQLSNNLRRNIMKREGNVLTFAYELPNFNCAKALAQPPQDGSQPYLWCNITVLFPKIWHNAIGGFDESLKTWEDIDYWWRMAKAGYCFHRIAEPLMLYRFSTGTRREIGVSDKQGNMQVLIDKHKDIEAVDMGCGCKGNNTTQEFQQQAQEQYESVMRTATARGEDKSMTDDNLVLVRYLSTNTGQHAVVGAATKTRYGYRGGGERFLVHRADIEAQPHMFSVVETAKIDSELPREKKQKLVEPVSIEEPAPAEDTMTVEARPVVISKPTLGEIPKPSKKSKVLPPYDPTNVSGIGASLAKNLEDAGINSPTAVVEAGMEGLMGISRMRTDAAQNLLEYAKRYVL